LAGSPASGRAGRILSGLRKAPAVIQILISSVAVFPLGLYGETWFFCQKFNGDDARLLVMPIAASGILIGALSLKKIRLIDVPMACWFAVCYVWIMGNRFCPDIL